MKGNMENQSLSRRKWREWAFLILSSFLIALFIKVFILNTTVVHGDSMNPTLYEEDRLIVNRLPIFLDEVKKGDIVVISAPDELDKDYVKRLIGEEGDLVQIRRGSIYLNGEELNEEYSSQDRTLPESEDADWRIEKGYVFVLGDNRANGASKDSRFFGPVPRDSIKGVVFFRYYPLGEEFGIVE
ncbi:MAG: signal peptidase I [Tissierellia bacterium]|nr:signal peptidase I [Tissierellia bacterium]